MIHIKKRVLIINNDLTLCQAIFERMQDNLMDVCCMTSAVEALANYMVHDYCLVILDAQLSDMDSMDLIRTVRLTKHTPILVVTDFLSDNDKIALYQAGADAYIEKPLNMDICVAQANALIQLYINSDVNHEQYNPIIYGKELIISPRYRQVMIDGKYLELTRKEFDLLHCFAEYPGQVFSCEQLYDKIWNDGPAIAIDEIVRSQIKRLRKKLASVGKDYIQNEWGVGYKFVISVFNE